MPKEICRKRWWVFLPLQIVSKRLANRLLQFKNQESDEEKQGLTSDGEGREEQDEG